jgi:serine/threonine protein kinase
MLTTGTRLQNRYEILKPIGQGGMGAVYLARDQRLGNTVALKETFFQDTLLLAAFEREAKLLAGLRHTALPKVIDHFADNNGQFLVMEYITGDDLHDLLRENGDPAPFDEVLQWADQLLDALDYLHSQEPPIIHRDIKPQNLKLTSRNQVVLLDFGLAKGTSLEKSQTSSTSSIFGYTPSYAPLEQIQGSGTDARSDIYSLAATLYHLLSGKKPVDALTRASCVLDGQPDPLAAAAAINREIPVAVSDVLMQGMALNKSQRLASANQMRAMLRDAMRAATADKATNAASSFARTEIRQAGGPSALPVNSTHVMASTPATSAQESAKPGSYTTRASATNLKRPTPAPLNQSSLNRARPGTMQQRRATTVEISGESATGLPKIIAAAAILIVAAALIVFVFARGARRDDASAAPASVQKTEPASGAEPSGAGAKATVEDSGGTASGATPAAPSRSSTGEEQAAKSDDEARKTKEPEAGKEVEQQGSQQNGDHTPTMQEPEGTKPLPPQPTSPPQASPPPRAEEARRDEPAHTEPPPPYPPPPDRYPPPGRYPPPPGEMPPPPRRRP